MSEVSLDQESSSKTTSTLKAFVLGGLTFSLHFLVTLVMCAYMMLVVPRYKRFADGFGAQLTSSALSVVQLSDLCVMYWYLFLFAVIVIDLPLAIALRFLPDKLRWVRTCWLVSCPLAAISFLFFESVVLAQMVENLTTELR